MIIAGYLAAAVMGVVLGLLGGGGSILAVPILVYLFQLNPVSATAYSLFIVGVGAAVGAFQYARQGSVDFKVATVFAIPAFAGVYTARKWIVPSLPDVLFTLGDYQLTKDTFILLFFAVIMLAASISMIRGRKDAEADANKKLNIPLIGAEGLIVGLVTGFVGAGGGFLVIPALVILAGLSMKQAVGTGLFIIAVKSLLGFIGDVQTNPNIDWMFLATFTSIAVVGIFGGTFLSHKISGAKLKPLFGWFVLVMGLLILGKEVL